MRKLLAAAAVAAVVTAPVPAAAADPFDQPQPLFDVSALPIDTARWQPITHHDRTGDVLPGIETCSWDGVPDAADLDPQSRAEGPVYVADLRPGFFADTQGWWGTVAAARYSSVDAASCGLDAYRRYLDACRTAPASTAQFHNDAVGTSALDPTLAHALIETDISWVEVFAAATDKGLIEVAMVHRKDGGIEFPYNPAALVNALKTADIDGLTADDSERL
jgi:hypothetical protein